jgi:hypothetical protein
VKDFIEKYSIGFIVLGISVLLLEVSVISVGQEGGTV